MGSRKQVSTGHVIKMLVGKLNILMTLFESQLPLPETPDYLGCDIFAEFQTGS